MSSPNFGDYAVAGIGGAALGFLDNQQKENEAAKVAKEQERQVQLLMLKEKLTAAREERKAGIEHGYKMNELGAKNKFEAEEKSKDRAAKIVEEGTKEELERWKVGKQSETSLGVANINAAARKESARSRSAGDERAIRSTQARLRKEYKRDVKDWEINNPGETAPDFDTWADENYPEDYDFAFPGGGASEAGGSGAAPSTKGESKLDSIFNEYGASRTKKGANDGKMPAATGAPGDVLEPQPIAVGAGDKVTSAAPVSGSGMAQAASGPPPVDELPMKQGAAPSRAAELKAQADAQRSNKLVSTAGAGEVFNAASEIAQGFVAGTKKGATILADLYKAFVGEPTEAVVKWAVASQNQQAATYLLEQRLKNGVINEQEYNAAVAKLRS